MGEGFETDLRAGYPDDASGAILGSPMLDGEVLAGVRVRLPLSNVNRHGLVAGATGTGKTKTLQMIAGQLSDAGVPVFVADVKGDLTGLAQPIDAADPKVAERASSLGWTVEPRSHPVELLSLTGARRAGPCDGRAVRARAGRQGARPERDPDRRALARVQVLRRPRSAAARPGRSPHDPAIGQAG